MTKVIILSDDTLDRYYERALQHLHDKFHTCPTNLAGQPISAIDAAQISYYETLARETARKSRKPRLCFHDLQGDSPPDNSSGGKSLGKMVF
jgi:hypothetical protein